MPSMYYVSQQLPLGIRASSPSGMTSSQSVRMPSSGRAEAVNVSILLDAADVVDRWARISSPCDRNTENQRVDERSLCKNIMSSVSKKENLSKSPFAEDFVLSSLGNVATSNSTRKKETQSGIVRKTKVGWSKKEDMILKCRVLEMIAADGSVRSWILIAEDMVGRTAKQCRERWCSALAPGRKKDKWTNDETQNVLRLQKKFGNQWSLISKHVPGRTDNDCKNRWNTFTRTQNRKRARDVSGKEDENETKQEISMTM